MSPLTIILIVAGVMAGVGLVAVLAWLLYTSWLNHLERRLAARKGFYRDLVSQLATRDRALLDPILHQHRTLTDLRALEAVLEEQARATAERPAWLLDVYDRLGLVDKYTEKLRTARKWRERAFAAELLGRVGNAKAVPALLETAQETRVEDADVREIALRALARIADPRAVEPLIEALRGADAWLAPRLADILTRHGDVVVDPLLKLLQEPTRHPARAWAANVLGEIRAPRAFPALVRSLGDLDDEVRGKAATALGRLGDRRAVRHLLEHLLTDPAPFVRARIAGTLGQFDDPEVVDRLVRALGDPAWWVRMRSIEALEQIGAKAEGPLLLALDDPDPEIRTRAAAALERLDVPEKLVRQVERGHRVDEALEVLAKFAAADARELLAEPLLQTSSEVRQMVMAAMERGASLPSAVDALRSTLDVEERVRLVRDLRASPGEQGRGALLHVLRSDPSPEVRAAALTAVGELLNGDDLLDAVRRALGDPSLVVRHAAVGLFGRVAQTFERVGGAPA